MSLTAFTGSVSCSTETSAPGTIQDRPAGEPLRVARPEYFSGRTRRGPWAVWLGTSRYGPTCSDAPLWDTTGSGTRIRATISTRTGRRRSDYRMFRVPIFQFSISGDSHSRAVESVRVDGLARVT